MSTPLVGIIGGYGPATSAIFAEKLVEYAHSSPLTHAPSFVMDSIPIPYRDAELCIAGDEDATRRLIALANDGMKRLDQMGVKYMALPCNSVHAFAETYAIPDGVTFLHIAEVCAKEIANQGYKKIGFLGSGMTIKSGFYTPYLEAKQIEVVLPIDEDQAALNKNIAEYVSTSAINAETKPLLSRIMEHFLEQDVDAIALCCTDTGTMIDLAQIETKLPIVDSMQTLAKACAEKSIVA